MIPKIRHFHINKSAFEKKTEERNIHVPWRIHVYVAAFGCMVFMYMIVPSDPMGIRHMGHINVHASGHRCHEMKS